MSFLARLSEMMKLHVAAAVLMVLAAGLRAEPPQDASYRLKRILKHHKIPALAVAATVDGDVVALGAQGRRRITEKEERVSRDDHWQLGSCTKSMTASVVAMLVEDGDLAWDTTIADLFPELADEMHPAWLAVTLEQLLTHRGGAPAEPPADLWKAACTREGTPTEQREAFVKGLLAHEPTKHPGTHWIYSDSGYAIVGVMMERATGKAWEDLLRERLFVPLGLTSAGFGEPATTEPPDQPWGHRGVKHAFIPQAPGPNADYPPAIAPAAAVHMSIGDFASYASWHVFGARGEGWLLTPASFKKLHTPRGDEHYAMGWSVSERRWAGGTVLMHNGDNEMFYAVMWLGPNSNTAFVAACNADGQDAVEACDEAITMLINEF